MWRRHEITGLLGRRKKKFPSPPQKYDRARKKIDEKENINQKIQPEVSDFVDLGGRTSRLEERASGQRAPRTRAPSAMVFGTNCMFDGTGGRGPHGRVPSSFFSSQSTPRSSSDQLAELCCAASACSGAHHHLAR